MLSISYSGSIRGDVKGVHVSQTDRERMLDIESLCNLHDRCTNGEVQSSHSKGCHSFIAERCSERPGAVKGALFAVKRTLDGEDRSEKIALGGMAPLLPQEVLNDLPNCGSASARDRLDPEPTQAE